MSHLVAIFPTPLATWSRRVALFSLQLLLLGLVLHRFLGLTTPVALNLFVSAFAGAVVAILLGLGALVVIWRQGRSGTWSAVAGILFGLVLLAWPAVYVPLYTKLPKLNDVSTDTGVPPRFVALAQERPKGANTSTYAGGELAALQAEKYPDIKPVVVPRSASETFELMGELARKLRWRVVAEQAPQGKGKPGYIEAVDRTLIVGFYDDVVIRLDGDARETRIDIRSASRYGRHDFGQNAARVRRVFKELEARLDQSVTGNSRRRGRRPDAAVPKRGKGAPVASAVQQKQQGRGQQGAQRGPQQKALQRSKGESPGRGRRPAQSFE